MSYRLDVLFRMLVVGCGLWLLSACKPGVPSHLIQPDELEEILYDYHIAQAMADTGNDSVNFKRYAYVRAALEKHGVTEAEFDTTMIWYSAHATYLNDIYKRLHERYSNEVSAMRAIVGETDAFADIDAQGDTADIWHEQKVRVLKPRRAESRQQFSYVADTTFRKGDVLLWRFNPRFVSRSRSDEAYAGLYIVYDNDSTAGVVRRVYSNSRLELRIEGDTAHAIRSVDGFVCYQPLKEEDGNHLLVLENIMLVRMHRHIEPVDSVAAPAATDSTQALPPDSSRRMPMPDTVSHRLSPEELRDSRPVERSINVVKEKPYKVLRSRGRVMRVQQ